MTEQWIADAIKRVATDTGRAWVPDGDYAKYASDVPLVISKYATYVPVTQEMLCDAGQCGCKVHHPVAIPKRSLWRRVRSRCWDWKYRIREAIKALKGTVHDDCD